MFAPVVAGFQYDDARDVVEDVVQIQISPALEGAVVQPRNVGKAARDLVIVTTSNRAKHKETTIDSNSNRDPPQPWRQRFISSIYP